MAAPRLKSVPQLGMDEKRIDDAGLIEALEDRQKRKNSLDAVRKVFDEANDRALAEIAKLELPEGAAVRVGAYRITRQSVPAGHREFDTKASSRIRISLADEG